jgi:hypothetical protein
MFLGVLSQRLLIIRRNQSAILSQPVKIPYVNNYTSQSIYLSVILSQLGRRKPHGAREESLLRQ